MAKKIPRIIEVIADAGPGGAPTHVAGLIKGMRQKYQDAEINLICPPGWLTDQVKDLVTIHPIKLGNALTDKKGQTLLMDLIKELASDGQKTIVHFHGVRAGLSGRLALKKQDNLLVVYTEHLWTKNYHLDNPVREALQLQSMRRADSVTDRTIAVSQAVADFLLAKKITTPTKITMISNGVEIPEELHEFEPKLKSYYVLGAMGSLNRLKDFATLIEAMPLIHQNFSGVKLEIVGEGPEYESLRGLVRKLRLQNSVTLSGPTAKAYEHYKNWDLFVSTSRSESFGLAIAEAMAFGLPVVATKVGAVPELVTSKTGRLVESGNAHDLAKIIIDLIPLVGVRTSMGQAARQRIIEHFSLQKMVDETTDLYKELAA